MYNMRFVTKKMCVDTKATTDPPSQQPPLLLRLKTDVKEAMKNKDKMRLNTVKV